MRWTRPQHGRLREMKATMWIEHQWSPQIQRDDDKSIMEEFHKIPGITRATLNKANWCRIYARVIAISDLTAIRGDNIPGHRLCGTWRAESLLEWPHIKRPPDNYWRSFRWCLRKTFATKDTPGKRTKQVSLDAPLGQWKPHERNMIHSFYQTARKLYEKNTIASPNTMYYPMIYHSPN